MEMTGDTQMMEPQLVKVYELAKELGVDSISLLDRLKSLNIQVKSHMSDLTPTDAEAARAALRAPVASEKGAKKSGTTRVRKKADSEAAGATQAGPATQAKTTAKIAAKAPAAKAVATKARAPKVEKV